MFPAAMLGLTMLVTLGMVAVTPPPPVTEETRARAAAEAVLKAQAAAVRHCRQTTCPIGELNIPNAAGRLSNSVLVRRQADGMIIAYWAGNTTVNGSGNQGQSFLRNAVSHEKVSLALQLEARKRGMNTERVGSAARVSEALGGLGSLSGNSGGLVSLGGINVPRNMPVVAMRG